MKRPKITKRLVRKFGLRSKEAERSDSEYWASRTPAERVAAVELLRKLSSREKNGRKNRPQRSVRIIKLGES